MSLNEAQGAGTMEPQRLRRVLSAALVRPPLLPASQERPIESAIRQRARGRKFDFPNRIPSRMARWSKNRLQGKPAGPRFKAVMIVTEGGEVSPGDRIRAIVPSPPHLDLPPL
jgi:hypothetical protein